MTLRNTHWSIYFLVWTASLTAAGAFLGAVLFLVGGLAVGAKFSARELVLNGLQAVGFVTFVWAMPIAIVACVARGYRRKHPPANAA